MIGRILAGTLLTVSLTSCFRTYTDVDLQTDAKILRGTYQAELNYQCQNRVAAVAWKPDGTALVTALEGTGARSVLDVWALSGEKRFEITTDQGIAALGWHPTANEFYVLLSDQRSVERFSGSTGSSLGVQTLPEAAGQFVALSADGSLALTRTAFLEVWDFTSGTRLWQKNISTYGYLAGFNADTSRVAYFNDNQVLEFDARTGALLATVNLNAYPQRFAWRGNELVVFSTQYVNSRVVLQLRAFNRDGVEIPVPSPPLSAVDDVQFSSSGQRMVVREPSTPLRYTVYDLQTGARLTQIERQDGGLVAFSPQADFLLIPGARASCGVEVLPLESATPAVKLQLEPSEQRRASFQLAVQYESDSSYAISGSVIGGGMDGYVVQGKGTGVECRRAGLVTDCDRYVRPSTSPILVGAFLSVTKPPAVPEASQQLFFRGLDGVWRGLLALDNKWFNVTLTRAP